MAPNTREDPAPTSSMQQTWHFLFHAGSLSKADLIRHGDVRRDVMLALHLPLLGDRGAASHPGNQHCSLLKRLWHL